MMTDLEYTKEMIALKNHYSRVSKEYAEREGFSTEKTWPEFCSFIGSGIRDDDVRDWHCGDERSALTSSIEAVLCEYC